jgi:D-arabinose 1-dehydrogenase-like Zn-dependent alcohol dehydrogenase
MAVEVARAGGPLELVEREMPEPVRGEVRLRVEACAVCHSDSLTVERQWPGLSFPRIPGPEVAGVIDAVGDGVVGWRLEQRVGVGWFGGHCGHCEPCRRGWLIDSRNLRIETMPLARAPDAYARMTRGEARFRMVLTIA